jgi:hypothetical protein
MPGLASDVFTCGLMLYELLAGQHPYWRDEQADYAQLVKAHAAKPPALLGALPAPAVNAEVSAVLHRCLAPDPARRPSAAELRDCLNGLGARPSTVTPPAARAAAVAPRRSRREPLVADAIELFGPDGRSLRIGVRTELGKSLVRQFGPDGDFWDDRQCVLEPRAGRQWVVSPIAGATNDTLLNGEALTAPRALQNGDWIAVGRQEKGIVKLPLTARGR